MRNKAIVLLSYATIAMIAMICIIQMVLLAQDVQPANIPESIQRYFWRSQLITLLLGLSALAIIFFTENIHSSLKRNAYTDITGIMNKHACMEQMSILDCRDSTVGIGLAMFDLNNLKKVNDFYGHEAGDLLIQQFVILLRQCAEKKFFLGRFGGDEFIVIIQNCDESIMLNFLEHVSKSVEKNNTANTIGISYACGFAISTRQQYYLVDELLKEADKKMYQNKKIIKSGELTEPQQISKVLDSDRVNSSEKDGLTGMFSHDTFVSTVTKVLQIYNDRSRLALVCSDIHNFRFFNELYGHKEGDHILRQFSIELNRQPFCLCSYRLYSDNFAFLADVSQFSEEQAVEMIQAWNIRFAASIDNAYPGSRFILKSGIYFLSNFHESVETMLNNAECARKSSKPNFQNIVVYSDELSREVKLRFDTVNSFQRALDCHEFHVYVQPKVSRRNKKICSAEALVRWQKSDGIFLPPDTFVPILEQSGDIINMDFYVYEKVFEYLYQQQLNEKTVTPLSVNVSRVHLTMTESFMERISRLHSRYPVPPSLITFELTESAYIQEIYSAEQFVNRLHALGYRVSMDDFGSGYSSLKGLYPMHFDEVKFDQAFIRNEITEEAGNWLIRLINLVKSLNTTIVCEGVETDENITLLEQSKCDLFQGYYFYKPFPLGDLAALVD
ncbi:MAG: EAL domain-containing protein [Lachnospiraceae bacterium]